MTEPIEVLIVDDSATLRQLIRAVLSSDSELKVVGMARNGEEGVRLCHELQPKVVTMDIRMPVMDGYEATRRIMAEAPRPIVVLTTTESDRELGITFKAIANGAVAVQGKPSGMPGEDPEADKLIQVVKAMAEVKVLTRHSVGRVETPEHPSSRPPAQPGAGPVRLVAVGTSTGGPPALQAILNGFSENFPLPIAVVQHISRGFVGGLAKWLDTTTPLRVKVAEHGDIMEGGTVYLAPDDRHLHLKRTGMLWTVSTEPVDGHRPSVTALFDSAAKSYGSSAIGVLLTGMGKDGARGLKVLHDVGGHTIVQDEASSIVFGMPKQAITLGVADEVLPLQDIGPHLVELVKVSRKEGEG